MTDDELDHVKSVVREWRPSIGEGGWLKVLPASLASRTWSNSSKTPKFLPYCTLELASRARSLIDDVIDLIFFTEADQIARWEGNAACRSYEFIKSAQGAAYITPLRVTPGVVDGSKRVPLSLYDTTNRKVIPRSHFHRCGNGGGDGPVRKYFRDEMYEEQRLA